MKKCVWRSEMQFSSLKPTLFGTTDLFYNLSLSPNPKGINAQTRKDRKKVFLMHFFNCFWCFSFHLLLEMRWDCCCLISRETNKKEKNDFLVKSSRSTKEMETNSNPDELKKIKLKWSWHKQFAGAISILALSLFLILFPVQEATISFPLKLTRFDSKKRLKRD